MQTPQEGIADEDGPLHSLQRVTAAPNGPLTETHGRAVSHCSCCATFMHFGLVRHPSVPQRLRECDHNCERIAPAALSPIVTLFPCKRFAKHDTDSVVICLRHRRSRKQRQPLPQRDRRPSVDLPARRALWTSPAALAAPPLRLTSLTCNRLQGYGPPLTPAH